MSLLRREVMLEQVREVKVVIFLEKIRNPFKGMVCWLERLRDLRGKGELEIWMRSASRLVSLEMRVRLREVRFGNLWKRRERESLIGDCEGAFQMVADGEELFGDGGERF